MVGASREWRRDVRITHPELAYIGKAVRRIAFGKDTSLADICRRSGIGASSFYAIMKSEEDGFSRAPSIDLFFAIADGLEVTPGFLIETMLDECAKAQSEGEE